MESDGSDRNAFMFGAQQGLRSSGRRLFTKHVYERTVPFDPSRSLFVMGLNQARAEFGRRLLASRTTNVVMVTAPENQKAASAHSIGYSYNGV